MSLQLLECPQMFSSSLIMCYRNDQTYKAQTYTELSETLQILIGELKQSLSHTAHNTPQGFSNSYILCDKGAHLHFKSCEFRIYYWLLASRNEGAGGFDSKLYIAAFNVCAKWPLKA